jgi:MIP family channel proteins
LYSLPRKLLAEVVGTFAIVFIAAGSVCAQEYLRAAGTGGGGLTAQALAYGLVTAVMMAALSQVSGGHFNPAITIGFWVTKRLGTLQSIFYCVAQLLGAAAAAYLLAALLPEPTWRPVALGSTSLASDFTRMQGMLIEGVATFFLVFVFFACAAENSASLRKWGALAVGMAISMDVFLAQPFTGASMNPARTFGPALAAHHWINHGVYWIGPLFGGVIGAVVYDRLFAEEHPST